MADRTPPIGIDLRREFSKFMEDHGYWALLRKRVGNKKAGSYNHQTEEGTLGFKQVLGSGEKFVDIWVRVRRMSLFDSPEKHTSIGQEASPLVRFYVQFHTKPDPHDFICEVSQDEESMNANSQIQPNSPVKVTTFWDIQESTPMREKGGRVEFWQVLVKQATAGDMS